MRYIPILITTLLFFVLISCSDIDRNENREVIARVNETFLYKDDIKDLTHTNTTKDDSINIINNYINIWATKQLFIDQSKRNLTEVELEEFNKLEDKVRNNKGK